jgi:hypothetical protein
MFNGIILDLNYISNTINKLDSQTLETLTHDTISKHKIKPKKPTQEIVINQSHGGNARRTKKYRKKGY